MPRQPRICPVCSQPARSRDPTITLEGVRHHLACARSAGLTPRARGRPPKPAGTRARDQKPLYVRCTLEQRQRWELHALERGVSLEDHVRQCMDDYYNRAHAPRLTSTQM
jgi:hypothetical protein